MNDVILCQKQKRLDDLLQEIETFCFWNEFAFCNVFFKITSIAVLQKEVDLIGYEKKKQFAW